MKLKYLHKWSQIPSFTNGKELPLIGIIIALIVCCAAVLLFIFTVCIDPNVSDKREQSRDQFDEVNSKQKTTLFENDDHLLSDYQCAEEEKEHHKCRDACRFVLVESIPLGMAFGPEATTYKPLYQAWTDLLQLANKSMHIASFYWTLTGKDIGINDSSSRLGEDILQQFQVLLSKNVSVFVASNIPTLAPFSTDLKILKEKGAHIQNVSLQNLTGGVLHTKFWIVDMKHIYIGSANMDWRSLTQVKELGAVIYNCSHLAKDLMKIFQTYWALGHHNASIPDPWPANYTTKINKANPLELKFNGTSASVYFTSSPKILCSSGRTPDLDAIISIIEEAEEFLYISVMEYFPTTRFKTPARYWPAIDNALRRTAFERGVKVQLLISCYGNTDPTMFYFLQSLQALNDPEGNITISVKLFIVPPGNHANIPYSRVNHSKFMVTNTVAYIGTSNWSEDYFSNTAGVGIIISQTPQNKKISSQTVQGQLKHVFERDWTSTYAIKIEDLSEGHVCRFPLHHH
ncbi:5'-3' exonuclease PLD4 [Protopterus annectens]|uniref:5'-3' exonuclease PLD4 n=1 Tax=Protopterus annectens TaxID=7888 RepID=UPI001CFB6D19|nr:5'-3' exonuclease PLD4 [Protopterus annectens]